MGELSIAEFVRPVRHPLSLRQLNGSGGRFVGHLPDPSLGPGYIAVYVITVLWIPVVPLGLYAVDDLPGGSYRVRGKVRVLDFIRHYRAQDKLALLRSFLLESVFYFLGHLIVVALTVVALCGLISRLMS